MPSAAADVTLTDSSLKVTLSTILRLLKYSVPDETVVGAMVGGLLMGVLNNGMSIMGVSIDWQQAIKGFVLLIAVGFDVISKIRAKV